MTEAPAGEPRTAAEMLAALEQNPKLLDQIAGKLADERVARTKPEYSEALLSRWDSYNVLDSFAVGDLAVWKPGLKNRRRPQYGEPCVVAQILEVPIRDESGGIGSVYFREKIDMIVGFLDEDRELLFSHVDCNRFRIYTQPDEAGPPREP